MEISAIDRISQVRSAAAIKEPFSPNPRRRIDSMEALTIELNTSPGHDYDHYSRQKADFEPSHGPRAPPEALQDGARRNDVYAENYRSPATRDGLDLHWVFSGKGAINAQGLEKKLERLEIDITKTDSTMSSQSNLPNIISQRHISKSSNPFRSRVSNPIRSQVSNPFRSTSISTAEPAIDTKTPPSDHRIRSSMPYPLLSQTHADHIFGTLRTERSQLESRSAVPHTTLKFKPQRSQTTAEKGQSLAHLSTNASEMCNSEEERVGASCISSNEPLQGFPAHILTTVAHVTKRERGACHISKLNSQEFEQGPSQFLNGLPSHIASGDQNKPKVVKESKNLLVDTPVLGLKALLGNIEGHRDMSSKPLRRTSVPQDTFHGFSNDYPNKTLNSSSKTNSPISEEDVEVNPPATNQRNPSYKERLADYKMRKEAYDLRNTAYRQAKIAYKEVYGTYKDNARKYREKLEEYRQIPRHERSHSDYDTLHKMKIELLFGEIEDAHKKLKNEDSELTKINIALKGEHAVLMQEYSQHSSKREATKSKVSRTYGVSQQAVQKDQPVDAVIASAPDETTLLHPLEPPIVSIRTLPKTSASRLPKPIRKKSLFYVKAIRGYSSPRKGCLSFSKDRIFAVTKIEDDIWYVGEYIDDSGVKREGLFPKIYVASVPIEKMTPTFATEPENGKQTLHTRLESWLNEVNPLSGIAQSQCSPSRQTPQLPECTQSCVVCGNEKTESKFPPRITSTCTHKPNTCKSCLRKWLASELESKGWDRISCPECRQTMQHADMQKHARKETFQRYDNLSTRATLSALPDFRWCLRPGCDSGQIHEITVEGPVFQCSSCGHLSCAVHNKAWHEGETCEQFDERKLAEPSQKRKEAEVSEKWKARNTKLCPGCRAPIQKNGGCSHMVCQHCSHDFDWKHAPAYTPPKVEPVVTASSPLGRPTSNLSKLSSLGRLINRTSTQRLYGSSLARASSPNPRRFTSRQDNLYV